MSKLPSFQFYPGDWMKDPDLSRCLAGARGLLADLLCLMHENHHRGKLCERDGITPWSDADILAAVRGDADENKVFLCELESKGVLKRDQNKCLYSSRMIRDEEIRRKRAESGSAGGVAKAKQKASKHPSKKLANALAKGWQNTEDEDEDEDISLKGKGAGKGKPNPLWDALVARFFPDGVAPSQRTRVGRLVRELRAVDAKPEEIKSRADNWATHYPEITCTPEALVKHWSLCGKRKGSTDPTKVRDRDVSIYEKRVKRFGDHGGIVQPSDGTGNTPQGGDGVQPAPA